MSLSKFERRSTIKSTMTFKDANGNLLDPSGNRAFISIIKPNGDYLVSGQSAARISTGTYEYYFTTSDTDPLGIWVVYWYAYSPHIVRGGIDFGYPRIAQRDSIQLVDVNELD